MKRSNTSAARIESIIAQLRSRQRWLNAARCSAHGLMSGAVVALTVVAIAWAAQAAWFASSPMVAAAIALAGAVGGAIVGVLLPIDTLRLARALDRAALGEDRFASAIQLAAHPRAVRARLIADDALARIGSTTPRAALPLRWPRTLRWTPLPLLAIAGLLLLGPGRQLDAATPLAPEISSDEWATLHEEFLRELRELPRPMTPEQEELFRELEELAALLAQKPEKKEALREIARLSERIEERRQSQGLQEFSMRKAARSMSQSQSLQPIASMLQQGQYAQAAKSMEELARKLSEKALSPDAAEFERMASDLDRLAQELASHDDLQQACRNCANAASSMNQQSLADALKRLSEQLKQNSQKLCDSDQCSRCNTLLEQLKRRMNQCSQCSGCKSGCSACQGNGQGMFPKPGGGNGGLRAGWGSAAKWDGGSLAKTDERRDPDMINVAERNGQSTSFTIVSPEERAESALSYEELYAEFVQKAEADLDLESVPVPYREYLRRYFNSIRPQESGTTDEPGEPAAQQ